MNEYAVPTAEVIREFGGQYVVRAPNAEALENGAGLDGYSVVVSKWPDRAAVDQFWASPAYEKLKAARQPLSEAHVLVVEDPS